MTVLLILVMLQFEDFWRHFPRKCQIWAYLSDLRSSRNRRR